MVDSITFKQHRPVKAFYIGVPIIIVGFIGWGNWDQVIILSAIGLLIIGFEKQYTISKDYINRVGYGFFGLQIFKKKTEILYPDYVSIFSINQKRSNEYGPVSAVGSVSKDSFFVIRLFQTNKYFTLYKSKNYNQAYDKAKELSKMLEIDLIDKTNQ